MSAPTEIPVPAETHGHKARPCFWCPDARKCDCPCATCIRCRKMIAGAACVACGSTDVEPTGDGAPVECANCRGAGEEEYAACCPDCGEEDECKPSCGACPDCGAYVGQPCDPRCGSSSEYGDEKEEEEHRRRCSGCGCVMDGDEGWGPHCCSRTCFHRLSGGHG